jgi:RNA polymerase sigma factor (sigma-70 family)
MQNESTRTQYGAAYEKQFGRTVAILRRRGVSSDLAYEIAQQAWVRGWERHYQLRNPTLLVAWINSSAKRTVTDYYRGGRFTVPLADAAEPEAGPTINVGVVDLSRALQRLPTHQSGLLRAVYLEGCTTDEVARDLGRDELKLVSRDAVHHRLSRARAALRRVLGVAPERIADGVRLETERGEKRQRLWSHLRKLTTQCQLGTTPPWLMK